MESFVHDVAMANKSQSSALWDAPLRGVVSKGVMADRPGSLGGLAAARRVHQGQFFTPDAVAKVMWQIVERMMEKTTYKSYFNILDNSVVRDGCFSMPIRKNTSSPASMLTSRYWLMSAKW